MNDKNTDIRTFDVKIRAETGLDNENSNNQAENGQNMAISGVAAVFNQPSIKGNFTEYIDQNALNNVDLSGVLLLYSHDFSNILARADAGTLTTSVQQDGLHFSAALPDTQLGHDTFTNIQNGNIKGMSFGFTIADGGDSWSVNSQGDTVHTINQVGQVFELSLTPIPAYTETSVQVQRDLAQFLSNKKEDVKMAEKPEEKVETENRDEQMRSLEKFKKQLADLQAQINTKVVIDQPAEEKRDAEPVAPVQAPATPSDDGTTTQPTSGDLVSMIATLQQAIQSLSQQLAAQQAPTPDDTSDDGDDVVLDQKKPAEQTAEQDVEPNENKRDGAKDMAKNLTEDKVEDEQVRDFKEFLRTGEVKRDSAGFDSAAGEAVLPSQVLDIMQQPNDPTQLSGYVNRVEVSAPTGKLPVMSKVNAQLVTATELAENPQIGNATITPVAYDVQTRRGQLPISLEMAQDYPNIVGLLTQYVNNIVSSTEQHQIGAVLQQATPVSATSIDDLKDSYNVGLSNYGSRMWVLSESMFAALDKAKDANGRYLLEDSISSATGKQFLGATCLVVSDDVLGNKGDQKAFVGDLSAFVLETIRGNVNLSWARNEQFEQVLLAAIRSDYKVADTAAGKFITFKPTASTTSTPTSGK
ncbi:phage major capsid protein [Schleiferilactobacillus harbinensis]|uniref:Phage-related prohead protease n=1 Tax=Schleiferilactobacillus harbinensis DSM 16991 TaxID=1122147 RepID=A0A0R1XEZ5_9LACO|nr:phage major capsid protein [Schleiferilactobacillus harbinensis]KRM26505.1 phage-related prohead protease [Schleiferilactobacillus harbinensis DSM 16991]QFR64994.1 phage major capsid protein [Schleiferilactobacillus harbinensis]